MQGTVRVLVLNWTSKRPCATYILGMVFLEIPLNSQAASVQQSQHGGHGEDAPPGPAGAGICAVDGASGVSWSYAFFIEQQTDA